MSDDLAQALCRLPAEPVAEACDPARLNPVAARRLVSGLGFDQFDPGGDIDAIGATFGGDPHGNAVRKSSNLYQLRLALQPGQACFRTAGRLGADAPTSTRTSRGQKGGKSCLRCAGANFGRDRQICR
jgi:hypothetical protein